MTYTSNWIHLTWQKSSLTYFCKHIHNFFPTHISVHEEKAIWKLLVILDNMECPDYALKVSCNGQPSFTIQGITLHLKPRLGMPQILFFPLTYFLRFSHIYVNRLADVLEFHFPIHSNKLPLSNIYFFISLCIKPPK